MKNKMMGAYTLAYVSLLSQPASATWCSGLEYHLQKFDENYWIIFALAAFSVFISYFVLELLADEMPLTAAAQVSAIRDIGTLSCRMTLAIGWGVLSFVATWPLITKFFTYNGVVHIYSC